MRVVKIAGGAFLVLLLTGCSMGESDTSKWIPSETEQVKVTDDKKVEDIETLESLVSPKLIKKFQEILHQRKTEGITAETDLISITSAEITNLKITKTNVAKITVKFISEQVNLLKNSNDEVIEGDENFVQNITDIWTFERNITSTNPNWLLTSTKK